MDSAGGATRPAGVAAAAHVLGATTNAAEESDARSPGALQHSDCRRKRHVWCGGQAAPGPTPGRVAGTHQAKCGTGTGDAGFPGTATRGHREATRGADESNGRSRSAKDAAVCGPDSEHGADAGDRQGGAVSLGCASGQLCRPGTAGALERWAHPAGADLRGCESVPEVGLYRSREPGGHPSEASGWSARSAAVSTGQAQEEPPESGCGRCPALSRSRLLDFEETGGLSRPAAEAEGPGPSAGCACSLVDARGSAEPAIALLRLKFDCDTRSRDLALAEVEGGYMASDEKAETAKRAELTKEKNQGHLLLTQREQKHREQGRVWQRR